jgi:hypothetical protein
LARNREKIAQTFSYPKLTLKKSIPDQMIWDTFLKLPINLIAWHGGDMSGDLQGGNATIGALSGITSMGGTCW